MELSTYPELIRLNPNVPWKTRGNGAVCLRYQGEPGLEEDILSICNDTIEELSVMEDPQTNPGLALTTGTGHEKLKGFYHSALHEIVTVEEAMDAARSSGSFVKGWKNQRGIIGALASAGADLPEFTFEAIMYRSGKDKERRRDVRTCEIDKITEKYPTTFFNVDETGTVVCIPRSPCPVILGIRATDPVEARNALLEIEIPAPERWVLWKTNQHTGVHIQNVSKAKDIKPFSSVSFEAHVASIPEYGEGGHLSFDLKGPDDLIIKAWAYEPTKGFRKNLSKLHPGDRIEVSGSIREPFGRFGLGINLERVDVIEMVLIARFTNPKCPACGGSTESMGRNQDLRCKSCGLREGLRKVERKVKRDLRKGTIQPPMNAWRHLYRPEGLTPASRGIPVKPFHGKMNDITSGNRKQG
jgi:tRNA(Ile2)-agmatinylcytidine synthase